MTWTRPVPPDAPDAPAAYAAIRAHSTRGSVSNLWQTLGLDGPGLEGSHAHYRALMADPAPLTTAQVAMLALAVSCVNGCAYCVAHQGPRLAAALGDEAMARAIALDYRTANLRAQDRVLIDYAVALTCEPSERKREDVERLREYGFDDLGIVKATEIVAYYNAANRVANGLGVEIESGLEPWVFGSQK